MSGRKKPPDASLLMICTRVHGTRFVHVVPRQRRVQDALKEASYCNISCQSTLVITLLFAVSGLFFLLPPPAPALAYTCINSILDYDVLHPCTIDEQNPRQRQADSKLPRVRSIVWPLLRTLVLTLLNVPYPGASFARMHSPSATRVRQISIETHCTHNDYQRHYPTSPSHLSRVPSMRRHRCPGQRAPEKH